VIAGGHYDSHDISPGALDNGAGVVVTLEAARALAAVARQRGRGFARPLRFCFFAAEEIGLLGSWEYVRRHRDELGRVRFMLNLDTAGRGFPGNEALVLTGVPELMAYYAAATEAMGYPVELRNRFSSASDHFPFAMNGVPTGGISQSQLAAAATNGLVGRGWGHTPADTLDKANPKSLQSAAMVAARCFAGQSPASAVESSKRAPHEVEQQLADSGLLDDLKLSGRWPPPR
jgi:aminopeptidase YwaD